MLSWPLDFAIFYVKLFVVTWVLYVFAMEMREHEETLHPIVKKIARAIVYGIGIPADALLQLLSTVPLWDLPRYDRKEVLLTARLKRLKTEGGWRAVVATWVCRWMLNPFQHDGDHC